MSLATQEASIKQWRWTRFGDIHSKNRTDNAIMPLCIKSHTHICSF